MSVAKQDEREVLQANMKLLEKISSGVMKKVALATAMVGGFLALAGAGTASAHPRVVVAVGIGGPVVVRGYVGPGPGMSCRVRITGRCRFGRDTDTRTTTDRGCAIGMRGFIAGAIGKNQIAENKIGRSLRLGRLHFVNGGKT